MEAFFNQTGVTSYQEPEDADRNPESPGVNQPQQSLLELPGIIQCIKGF